MAGIYIHVPFCQSRCAYCDFYSTTLLTHRAMYVDTLCRELRHRLPELQGQKIETIYFGGGTPSTLTIDELSKILRCIKESATFNNSINQEITLEANPDDLKDEYVQGLHRLQQAGLTNISIDLIYGLPGETIDDWSYSLDQAILLGVKHISAYHLTYEEGTRLWRMKELGLAQPIDEEQSVLSFELLREKLLSAGYEHYEISNFAQPDYHSRHNSSYWQGTPYIGIGPGAHSYDGHTRRWNLSDLTAYLATPHGEDVPHEEEHLTEDEHYDERIITELRTSQGIDLNKLLTDLGERYHSYCLQCAAPYIHRGQLIHTHDNHLHLTPESILISDAVMRDLLW